MPWPDTVDEDELAAAAAERKSDLWCYRVRRFRELGFTRPQRVRLANEGADWHEAADLLRRGCAVELVFDLLSS